MSKKKLVGSKQKDKLSNAAIKSTSTEKNKDPKPKSKQSMVTSSRLEDIKLSKDDQASDQTKHKSIEPVEFQQKKSSSITASSNQGPTTNVTKEQLTSRDFSTKFEQMYRKLDDACSNTKHLSGMLRKHQSQLSIQLPEALPSAVILRALAKQGKKYKELTAERLTTHIEQIHEVGMRLDGLNHAQLTTFISELDDLIGDFVGRS